jgi:hypothetical protein
MYEKVVQSCEQGHARPHHHCLQVRGWVEYSQYSVFSGHEHSIKSETSTSWGTGLTHPNTSSPWTLRGSCWTCCWRPPYTLRYIVRSLNLTSSRDVKGRGILTPPFYLIELPPQPTLLSPLRTPPSWSWPWAGQPYSFHSEPHQPAGPGLLQQGDHQLSTKDSKCDIF